MIRITLAALMAGACTSTMTAEEADPDHLDWFSGCWRSLDGSTREIWSTSEDGHYFGYSVVLNAGKLVFFEQMRIDPADMPVFNAYPRGAGPSAFPAVAVTENSITFANPEHDFPQKIKYVREGDQLKAVISLIDDTRQGHFNYIACPTDEED
ncbi:MAG: DUF6265 family protein [Pseudomonadota bacterium]